MFSLMTDSEICQLMTDNKICQLMTDNEIYHCCLTSRRPSAQSDVTILILFASGRGRLLTSKYSGTLSMIWNKASLWSIENFKPYG